MVNRKIKNKIIVKKITRLRIYNARNVVILDLHFNNKYIHHILQEKNNNGFLGTYRFLYRFL